MELSVKVSSVSARLAEKEDSASSASGKPSTSTEPSSSSVSPSSSGCGIGSAMLEFLKDCVNYSRIREIRQAVFDLTAGGEAGGRGSKFLLKGFIFILCHECWLSWKRFSCCSSVY